MYAVGNHAIQDKLIAISWTLLTVHTYGCKQSPVFYLQSCVYWHFHVLSHVQAALSIRPEFYIWSVGLRILNQTSSRFMDLGTCAVGHMATVLQ
jgi:hypothetical protein